MFELPVGEILNAAVSAKNEVTVEMVHADQVTVQDKRKDTLVDIRFYIPPHASQEDGVDEEELTDAATVTSSSLICTHASSKKQAYLSFFMCASPCIDH